MNVTVKSGQITNIFDRIIQKNGTPGGRLIAIAPVGGRLLPQLTKICVKEDSSSSAGPSSSSAAEDHSDNLDFSVTDYSDDDSRGLTIVDDGAVTPSPIEGETSVNGQDHCYKKTKTTNNSSYPTLATGVAPPKLLPVTVTGTATANVMYLVPKYQPQHAQERSFKQNIKMSPAIGTSLGGTLDESRPHRKRIRKPPQFDKRSEEYKMFRERNNSAVKKSRTKAKLIAKSRCLELEIKLDLLKRENDRLLQLLEEANDRIEYLTSLVTVKDEVN